MKLPHFAFLIPFKGLCFLCDSKIPQNTFGYSKDEPTFVIFMIFAKEPLYTVL